MANKSKEANYLALNLSIVAEYTVDKALRKMNAAPTKSKKVS